MFFIIPMRFTIHRNSLTVASTSVLSNPSHRNPTGRRIKTPLQNHVRGLVSKNCE
jgi:hypothetical protein